MFMKELMNIILKVNSNIMLQLRNEVLYKILQSILQFRVQVKKEQFTKFNSLIKQIAINHKNSFEKSTSKMLTSIILQQKYNVRQSIEQQKINSNQTIKIALQFYLKDRKSEQSFTTQIWNIETSIKNNQKQMQNFDMLLNVFQQLIFFLNKRPMFDLYQKNAELRKKYQVHHNILLQNILQKSLLDLPKVQKQIRQSKNLNLKIDCYYTSDLQSLYPFQKFETQSKSRKQSINIQNNQNSTKVSVYSFYDPVLNFTFISSDSEDFKTKENLKLHEIQNQNSDDEQFQILIMSEDQKFIDQNQKSFIFMSQHEEEYLNSSMYMS